MLDRSVTLSPRERQLEKTRQAHMFLQRIEDPGTGAPSRFYFRLDTTQHPPYGVYHVFYRGGRTGRGKLKPLGRQLSCPSYEQCVGMRKRFINVVYTDVLIAEIKRHEAKASTPKVLDLDRYEQAVRERRIKRLAKKRRKSSLPALKAKVTKLLRQQTEAEKPKIDTGSSILARMLAPITLKKEGE